MYLVRSGAKAADIHDIDADLGGPLTIDAGDTIDFDASDLSWDDEANTQALRGIVVKVETDGGDSTIKRLQHAIDKSVLQNVVLSGEFDSTNSPILVREGTRNSIAFDATAGNLPPIQMAETTATSGIIQITPRNPFHQIRDDAGPTTVNLNYQNTLEFKADKGDFTVTKIGSVVTVNLASSAAGLPIGSFIPSYKLPIQDGATNKYYIDRDGVMDKDWALADGISNPSPASGIAMWDRGGSDSDTFFLRAKESLANADNTPKGRTVPPGDPNVDVTTLNDHDDHSHQILNICSRQFVAGTGGDPLLCSFPPDGSGCFVECVGGVKKEGACAQSAPVGVLEHAFDNGQGAILKELEMTPPNKQLHWFERVA